MASSKADASGKAKRKRLQLEFHFKSVQPNIVVFYAIRTVVAKHFWDIEIHGYEAADFGMFDVYLDSDCIFTRKDFHGYPNIGHVLREIYLALNKTTKPQVPQAQSTTGAASAKGKGEAVKDTECKPMDLSKLDVKRWLITAKGLV